MMLFRRFNLIVGATLIGLIAIMSLVSFFWLPYDPNTLNFEVQLQGFSRAHWLGTDEFGRDLFSRLMVGSRGTFYVGFVSVTIGLSFGSVIGSLAGYLGGLFDEVFMRLIDAVYAFPAILMALLLAAVVGPGTFTAMVAIGIATIPIFSRIIRASVLSVKEEEFVEAGRALGAGHIRLLGRHILPNITSPIIVQASLSLSLAVLAEASLSFLGLGTPPDVPSWGNMLREAQAFLTFSPLPALVPGIAITITVFGWSLLGDGIRDILDPYTRR
jgi:peptide/nickel transport system permease protein